MKSHLFESLAVFTRGCDRAEALVAIYKYLSNRAPSAMDCDDLLRASIVLGVSSMDLLIHEVFRTEVSHRFASKKSVRTLKIPFDAGFATETTQVSLISEHFRTENSYKSFVAPDKMNDCLRHIVDNPWEKISDCLKIPVKESKQRLRRIIDLRNRIAHEGDVNPNYGGTQLWPIYEMDVDSSLTFIRAVGTAVAVTVDNA